MMHTYPNQLQLQGDNDIHQLLSEMYALLADTVLISALGPGYLRSLHSALESAHASENTQAPLSLLPLLACQAAGGVAHGALPVAAAWRAIHLAAKLLDDIQDADTPADSDAAISINRATGFFSAAGLALLQLDPAVQRIALPSFYKTILVMSSGQHTETAYSTHTLSSYMDVISAKSGGFFALATSWGANCATFDQRVVSLLDGFGFNLGIFIQIADDYLDWHNPQSKVISAHAMLPVCYIRSVGTTEQKAQLEQLLATADSSELRRLASEAGADTYMLAEMVRHKIRALALLDKLDKLGATGSNTTPLRDWFNRISAFAPA